MQPPLRVLLVEPSPLALKVQQQMLQGSPEIAVVGTARQGREALTLLDKLRPNVVCLAARMPAMSVNSPKLIQEIMSLHACPILVMTTEEADTTKAQRNRELVQLCLQAGAVDAFTLPADASASKPSQTKEFAAKIKILARVPVISRSTRRATAPIVAAAKPTARPTAASSLLRPATAPRTAPASRLVAIGASTGGPQVLLTILCALPRDYPFPVVCVQHISNGFTGGLVDWLDEQCKLRVKIAAPGEYPLPGTIYFPEDDKHLEVADNRTLKLSPAPPVDGHRPSVTALFNSVARAHGSRAIAVLLTGMGADGAQGLKAIRDAQGTTLVQERESCVVFGMPAKAIELGAAQHVLTPKKIADFLLECAQTAS